MPQSNDIVRLKTPESVKATGEPDCFRVTKNGEVYELPWGADFRVSSHCDPDNKIGNMDAKGGYPLIHTEFAEMHKSQFEIITQHED